MLDCVCVCVCMCVLVSVHSLYGIKGYRCVCVGGGVGETLAQTFLPEVKARINVHACMVFNYTWVHLPFPCTKKFLPHISYPFKGTLSGLRYHTV